MKADLATRFPQNPLLSPRDLPASRDGLVIECLLNPGVFKFENKIWLLIRVAERPIQKKGFISFPVLSITEGLPANDTPNNRLEIIELDLNDPQIQTDDPRVIRYKGMDYLSTLSHLRLVCSDDGIHFSEPIGYPLIQGENKLERFGIEDCRVVFLEGRYFLTFTAVSDNGVGVGLKTTTDWKIFESHGMILPPHNKDCAIFEEKINGLFYALHRPSSVNIGGNYIWIAESKDGIHWGNHQIILKTRKDYWDSVRIGAGAAPIKTSKGLLEIYHGANENNQYCLGAFLMDINNPSIVIARTMEPIMKPQENYEKNGFLGNVIFTNGHLVDHDELTIYYGASDEFVCGAKFSIQEIISYLNPIVI